MNANVSEINHFVTMAFQALLCLINDSLSSFIRRLSGRNEFTSTAESDIKVNPQAEKKKKKVLVIADLFTNLAYKTSQSCCYHQKCHYGGGIVLTCGFLLSLTNVEQHCFGNVVMGVSTDFLRKGRREGMRLLQCRHRPPGEMQTQYTINIISISEVKKQNQKKPQHTSGDVHEESVITV